MSARVAHCYSEERIIDLWLPVLILCHFCDSIMCFLVISLQSFFLCLAGEPSPSLFGPVMVAIEISDFHLHGFQGMIKLAQGGKTLCIVSCHAGFSTEILQNGHLP